MHIYIYVKIYSFLLIYVDLNVFANVYTCITCICMNICV